MNLDPSTLIWFLRQTYHSFNGELLITSDPKTGITISLAKTGYPCLFTKTISWEQLAELLDKFNAAL